MNDLHYPLCASSSAGARIREVGGRELLDLAMGFGCHLFGHNPSFLIDALRVQLGRSLAAGVGNDVERDVTLLFQQVTGHDLLELRPSGTEAIMSAVRVARAVTGRRKLVVFSNAYHGHADATLVTPRPGGGSFLAAPMAIGTAASLVAGTLVLPFGSASAFDALRDNAGSIAAVLVEPVQNRRPDFRPVEFLRALREQTADLGIPLIFDEILLGLRVHQRGAQGLFEVVPDLSTYGKILGGGVPLAALGASQAFLDRFGGKVQSAISRADTGENGAFVTVAARAMLGELARCGPVLQSRLNARTDEFVAGLNRDFAAMGVPLGARNFGSFLRFCQGGNFSFVHTPLEFELFLKGLVADGVYVVEGATCFLSTAHTDEDLTLVRATARRVVERMLNAGFWQAAPTGQPRNEQRSKSEQFSSRQDEQGAIGVASAPHATDSVQVAGALRLGVSFFGTYERAAGGDAFAWLVEAARRADALGFSSVWLPERHFHPFGGFCPNPSVLAAAIAVQTQRIKIRAGSVILPLHHPVRVAEEWAMVDNLSRGRVGLTFASGWQANDFVLAPGDFAQRKEKMFDAISKFEKLWRGEALRCHNDLGKPVELVSYPRPIQPKVPIWIASLGSVESFERAGALGFGVLTNLIGQDIPSLAEKVRAYQLARERSGLDPKGGNVAVLVHTLVGHDLHVTREAARKPLYDYLTSAADLREKMFGSGATDLSKLPQAEREYILGKAFERYVGYNALIGTSDSCRPVLAALSEAGVDEVACFVDFGAAPDVVDAGLPFAAALLSEPAPRVCTFDGASRVGELSSATRGETTVAICDEAENLQMVPPLLPRTVVSSRDQQLLFLQNELGQHRARAYHVRSMLRVKGPLHNKALVTSWQELMARHEVLRSILTDDGCKLRILAQPAPTLRSFDLTLLDTTAREETLGALLREEWSEQFDLTRDAPCRLTLVRLDAEEHVLVLTVHHAMLDAAGTNVLLEDLGALYSAHVESRSAVLPLPLQTSEFLTLRTERLSGGKLAEHERYFRQIFPAGVPPLDLPTDYVRPRVRSFRGDQFVGSVPDGLFSRLKRAARLRRFTPFMVVLSAYGVLLQRWTRQSPVVIGTSVQPGWVVGRSLAGWSTNFLPLLIDASDGLSLLEFTERVRTRFLDTLEHADVPYSSILDWFDAGAASPPMVATTLNWDKVHVPQLAGLEVRTEAGAIDATRFDLAVDINELPNGPRIYWDFSTDLFRRSTVEALHAAFIVLLEGIVAALESAPNASTSSLPLKTAVEVSMGDEGAGETTLLRRFLESVERQPHDVAVVDASGETSYTEVHRRAVGLTNSLRSAGVQAGDRVLAHLPLETNLIVALLACWGIGAALVPLDVAQPSPWKVSQAAVLGPRVLLTRSGVAELLVPGVEVVDVEASLLLSEPDGQLATPDGDQPAYVVFTSGSTGTPKAVVIHQSAVAHYAHAVCSRLQLERGVYLCVSPPQVDLGYTMWFAALWTGGTLVLAPGIGTSQGAVLDLVRRHPPDYLKLTPSLFEALWGAEGCPALLPSRKLIFGGEALRWDLVEKVRVDRSGLDIVNHYGPAEATVGVAAFLVPASCLAPLTVPVGRELGRNRLFVMDPTLHELPDGLVGELCVAGPGLGAGYWNDESQTADRFVIPESGPLAGTRLYRTGDRARVVDGELEILGRLDHQIKVHGFRVEPSAIEALLLAHPAVARAVVIQRSDDRDSLVAYYTLHDGAQAPSSLELRDSLRSQVPNALVPSFFIEVPSFQLKPGGKLDVASLPKPASNAAGGDATATTEAEQTMLKIWRDVLQEPELGLHDDFFDLGGHSLHAVKLSVRIRREFGVEAGLDVIFDHSTVTRLVKALGVGLTSSHQVSAVEAVAS
ncbi:MAG TPA: MupA/Atu3671 family FMN-dependent luciferase-like monooxygenase [Polyangiaceae bacterium]|nr:MupA/Atu3671 family FMN-dependent luciferase-like monooxygenase [Polyangiaceae bacterium]